ncbi:unnamed protein product [Chrysodeixis includens]|uniref:Uncharacterized protein n=1 Tax=Chrysodeixis includens TaxID=689277 RepID=A0A9P0BN38_CHRIL|nr:unnamed protein product [Chrysodeixis includens]
MCTNALEDYICELVECFEDYVKKSLLLVSVTLGTIVLMVMYVLKLLADRPNASLTADYDEYDYGEAPAFHRRLSAVEFQTGGEATSNSPFVAKKIFKDKAVNTDGSFLANSYDTMQTQQSLTMSNQTRTDTDASFIDNGVNDSEYGRKSGNRPNDKNFKYGDKYGNINDDMDGNINDDVDGNTHGDKYGNVPGDKYGNINNDMTRKLHGVKYGNINDDMNGNTHGDKYGNVPGDKYGNINNDMTRKLHGDKYGNINDDMNGNIGGDKYGNINDDMKGNIRGDKYGNINDDMKGNIRGDKYGNVHGDKYGNIKGSRNDPENYDKNGNRNVYNRNPNIKDNATATTELECDPTCADKIIGADGKATSCKKSCHEDFKLGRSRNESPPQCLAKRHLSNSRPCKRFLSIRSSCCSMCCMDDNCK